MDIIRRKPIVWNGTSREDIRAWNPVAREIAPDPALRSLYDARYFAFRQLYERNRDLMRLAQGA